MRVRADRVVVCAGAVQSPALLLRSGLRSGGAGRGFMTHPGVSMIGRFEEPVTVWRGATQGHEVTGLRRQGIKFEALGYDMALAAARTPWLGRELVDGLQDLAHHAHWGAAIRAEATGRVRSGRLGTRVRYVLTGSDVRKTRLALRTMGQMMFLAGAQWVAPGVAGVPPVIQDLSEWESVELPTRGGAYTFAATHAPSRVRYSTASPRL